MLRHETGEPRGVHRGHPARVEIERRQLPVEDLVDLFLVGHGVRLDLFAAQHRPRRRLSARIADQRREIADEKNDLVAEVLKLPHLVEQHGVTEVEIRRRRIEACLDLEWTALAELFLEFLLAQHLVGATRELTHLIRDVGHTIPYI